MSCVLFANRFTCVLCYTMLISSAVGQLPLMETFLHRFQSRGLRLRLGCQIKTWDSDTCLQMRKSLRVCVHVCVDIHWCEHALLHTCICAFLYYMCAPLCVYTCAYVLGCVCMCPHVRISVAISDQIQYSSALSTLTPLPTSISLDKMHFTKRIGSAVHDTSFSEIT